MVMVWLTKTAMYAVIIVVISLLSVMHVIHKGEHLLSWCFLIGMLQYSIHIAFKQC